MHFEKISREQWTKDCGTFMSEIYDDIKLPKQGTAKSMGVDFFAPYDIELLPESYHVVPTGIRWIVNDIDDCVGLIIVPRSGLGFKHGIRLANTIGIIDADYQFANNEGHIMIKLYNPTNEQVIIEKGKGFAQGIITPYIICDGAESDDNRTGGFGSTTK